MCEALRPRRRPRPLLRHAVRARRQAARIFTRSTPSTSRSPACATAVSEPLPGEIRLQWWRDALQGEARGDVTANPVAAALDDTIVRFRLPRARASSTSSTPASSTSTTTRCPTLTDLEGYCGETSSALIRLASLILADGGDPGARRRGRPCRRRLCRHRPAPRLPVARAARAGLPADGACSTGTA